jgi:hypothetical protein
VPPVVPSRFSRLASRPAVTVPKIQNMWFPSAATPCIFSRVHAQILGPFLPWHRFFEDNAALLLRRLSVNDSLPAMEHWLTLVLGTGLAVLEMFAKCAIRFSLAPLSFHNRFLASFSLTTAPCSRSVDRCSASCQTDATAPCAAASEHRRIPQHVWNNDESDVAATNVDLVQVGDTAVPRSCCYVFQLNVHVVLGCGRKS